ncbi:MULTISPECIES: hypothetical protein [unclassified Brachybacterium]|uniref:hypothetical protein n=1 Tax=unclassified Brachybacterium TaxID=2623841 RepID=UPI004033E6F5
MGVLVVLAAPFRSDSFWDPVAFSWPLLGLLVALTAVLTIGFLTWAVLLPEQPEHDTRELVDRAVRRDRGRADDVRRGLEAEAGRADPSAPGRR